MVAGRSKDAIAALARKLESPEFAVQQRHISNGHSNPLFGVSDWPDILVFHVGSACEDEVSSLLENPPESRPATIIIGPANNMKCVRLSMQAGVRDYLDEPLDDAELRASLNRIRSDLQAQPTGAADGLMTALVSTKGGCGASFLAANMAHVLAAENDEQVALLELDLQFGSLAQYLDLKPKHGLIRARDMADQLDATALNAFMAKHDSGLSLMSPLDEEIILARDIDPERFAKILALLKSSFNRVFVDLPRQIDQLSAEVYESADHILLVTQQEYACVTDAARLRRLILTELAVPPDRITMVINRYDKNSIVELADISRTIGVNKEDFILIPNAYKSVAESINIGVPMYEHARGSAVTKAIIAANKRLEGQDLAAKRGVVGRVLSNLIGG